MSHIYAIYQAPSCGCKIMPTAWCWELGAVSNCGWGFDSGHTKRASSGRVRNNAQRRQPQPLPPRPALKGAGSRSIGPYVARGGTRNFRNEVGSPMRWHYIADAQFLVLQRPLFSLYVLLSTRQCLSSAVLALSHQAPIRPFYRSKALALI
jgi:hypothetical protein